MVRGRGVEDGGYGRIKGGNAIRPNSLGQNLVSLKHEKRINLHKKSLTIPRPEQSSSTLSFTITFIGVVGSITITRVFATVTSLTTKSSSIQRNRVDERTNTIPTHTHKSHLTQYETHYMRSHRFVKILK